jgi:IS30 family transposase
MRCYTQLTQNQRYQIHAFKKAGFNQTQIAQEVGVHKSTICRELRRNRGLNGYRGLQAHRFAVARRRSRSNNRITVDDWKLISVLIQLDWSPEQIAGRLRLEDGTSISHEWIYRFIYADKQIGGELYRHLRLKKRYRKRYGVNERRGRQYDRVSIDERPAIVDSRSRLGDWEGDTIVGSTGTAAIVSLVERKTSFTLIGKLSRKTAAETLDSITGMLEPFKSRVHTITCDNGKEFTYHKEMAASLGASVYFAHPYASWERGSNENTNGLIRQYFPRKCDFAAITNQQIRKVTERLNHRPRKKLGFKTPFEEFFKTDTLLTVALNS